MSDQLNPAKYPVAFISYKWESESHLEWVRTLASDLRKRGVDAKLDQWEVRPGDSFSDYMQRNVAAADVILFVITEESVRAAEAPEGKGGALKFEVQMMNARRIAEGTRIIGLYRSGDRPPHYLRDHRYIDFREDEAYQKGLQALVDTIHGKGGAPPIIGNKDFGPPTRPLVTIDPRELVDGGSVTIKVISKSAAPVVWLNRTLIGPNGSIYGGGSTYAFVQTTSGVWEASWNEAVSPWTPSGTYELSNVSVRNKAELESEPALPVTFKVTNSRISERPTIESVALSAHRIFRGHSITISVRARSSAPVNWLEKSLQGPVRNLYGGGSGTRFEQVESGIWLYQWKESFSEWAPVGQYTLFGIKVRNEAQLSSEPWPAIDFEVV